MSLRLVYEGDLSADAEANEEKSFFLQIKELTIVGYFTSEQVGKNILRYEPRTKALRLVAGTGKPPAAKVSTADLNGSAQDVTLSRPHGVFVRRDGTLFIADSDNGRILSLRP